VRISATDWAAGGWDLDQTIETAKVMKNHGVDLVDVSTGGIISGVTIPAQPNYQVPFAHEVREKALIPTTAVGLITKAKQAARIVRKGQADAVEIGRAALRDPYWPLRASYKLG
jgi:2,4-dienoyl-CoA reductase-like NADH-dependent reductase (Old Yellow Enzyme family)